VQELERRNWRTKRWTTRKGRTRGGMPFTRTNLYQLLTRVAFIGRVQYKRETHPGEHTGIVGPEVWQRVQALLSRHGRRDPVRIHSGALLQRWLHCAACGCRMVPTYCLRSASTRYRYYRCANAKKRGARTCPAPLATRADHRAIRLDQVRALASDSTRLYEMAAAGGADEQADRDVEGVGAERLRLVLDPAWRSAHGGTGPRSCGGGSKESILMGSIKR